MGLRGASTEDSASDGGIFTEINITPLTDIFLVLLIIFMVTSSVMSQLGVSVNLPKASPQTSESQPEGVIVTLLPAGAIQIGNKKICPGDFVQFESILKTSFQKTSQRLVILEGDRQALLGAAIEVMDHARIAGAEKFAIATTPEGKN